MTRGFGERYAFADRGVNGNAIEVLQLKCPQAESDQDFRIEARIWASQQRADHCVQAKLPA